MHILIPMMGPPHLHGLTFVPLTLSLVNFTSGLGRIGIDESTAGLQHSLCVQNHVFHCLTYLIYHCLRRGTLSGLALSSHMTRPLTSASIQTRRHGHPHRLPHCSVIRHGTNAQVRSIPCTGMFDDRLPRRRHIVVAASSTEPHFTPPKRAAWLKPKKTKHRPCPWDRKTGYSACEWDQVCRAKASNIAQADPRVNMLRPTWPSGTVPRLCTYMDPDRRSPHHSHARALVGCHGRRNTGSTWYVHFTTSQITISSKSMRHAERRL